MPVITPAKGQSTVPGTRADLVSEVSISIALAGRHVRGGRFAAARRQLTHSLRLIASLEALQAEGRTA